MDQQMKEIHDLIVRRAHQKGVSVFEAARIVRGEMEEAGVRTDPLEGIVGEAALIAIETVAGAD